MNIVFFDGYCNLCNSFIDWLVRRDKHDRFRVASLQGETARQKLHPSLISTGSDVNTMVYLREDRQFEKSSAVLMIASDLGGIWILSKSLFIFPQFFRDWVYDFVARHRYKIFGQRQTCRLPKPEERKKFLD